MPPPTAKRQTGQTNGFVRILQFLHAAYGCPRPTEQLLRPHTLQWYQFSSGSLLCFCCFIHTFITRRCGRSLTRRTCIRTGKPWIETSFFVR